MMEIINIFKEEIIKIFKDKGSVLIMVGGFFLYGLFYLTPFSGDILTHVPIGIIDNDNTPLSRELVRSIDSSELTDVKYKLQDTESAKKLFYKNKIRAYVLIPKDFEKNILNGRYSNIVSYEDSAYVIIYKQVASSILTSSISMGTKLEIGAMMKKGLPKKAAMAARLPFEFVENPLYNPIGSYQNYILPLALILILQQTLLVGGGLLCATDKEKVKGIKENIEGKIVYIKEKYSKLSDNPHYVVLGKSLAYFSIYFVYSLICFYVFPSVANYHINYNPSSLLIIVVFVLSVSLLAQVFVAFYETREAPMFIMVPASVPFIFMTGFVWPKSAIPSVVNVLSSFIPSVPASDAFVKINQMGASFYQVINDFYILVFLVALYYFLAVYIANKIMNKNS